jgi:uncharacterized membrane protein
MSVGQYLFICLVIFAISAVMALIPTIGLSFTTFHIAMVILIENSTVGAEDLKS